MYRQNNITNNNYWVFSLFTCFVLAFTGGQPCIQDDIRLVGGPNEFEGTVEICGSDGVWGQVCGTIWDTNDARVVCRQLGYSSMGGGPQSTTGNNIIHGTGDGPGLIDSVTCNGTESTLVECPHSAINNTSGCGRSTAVVCQDPVCFNDSENVRLVGGDSDTEGRVEICSPSFFRRGVCDTNWDANDARVVCRELGLLLDDTESQATSEDGVRYIGSILTNVSCNGNEEQFRRCSSDQTTLPLTRCDLSGVRCQTQPPISTQTPSTTVQVSTVMTSTRIETEPTTTAFEPPGTQVSFTSEAPTEDTTTTHQNTSNNTAPTEDTTTTRQSSSNNTPLVIGIGVGVVGGLLLLLVVAVLVVVLVCILGRKRNKKVTYETQETINLNKYSHNSETIKTVSITPATEPAYNNTSVYEETQRELLNPIYKPNERELATESEVYLTGYADLEEVRPKEATRTLPTEPPNYYSTPTPPILEKSAAPQEYSEPDINVATTDVQGYASLESPHTYDDTKHPSGLGDVACPYETPLSPNGSAQTQSESSRENLQEQQQHHVYEIPTTDLVEEHVPTVNVSHPYATLERP